MWMFLVLIYGLTKGTRELVKKKALQKNSVIEVLFFYTLLSFLFVVPDIGNASGLTLNQLLAIAFKSFVIFVAWIFSFRAIEHMPISFYGILDLSRVLFATSLGIIVLHEPLTLPCLAGLLLVCTGLLMLKPRKGKEINSYHVNYIYVIMAIVSCILNAVSGLLDKILMKDVSSSQLQFWYLFFLVLMYAIYLMVTKTKLPLKQLLKNYWIWILSILFVIADRCLFIANGIPGSKLTVMTLIKQSGCIITILGGKFIFKEKHIGYKLLCACIIILGIVISVQPT